MTAMLKQLDVFIGFAAVMSVVSLLITIITQMVSSLLGLRGKNLSDALGVMFERLDLEGVTPEMRKQFVHYLLTRPALSDSILSMAETPLDGVPLLSWLRKRWRVASSIRPEELLAVLQRITSKITLADAQKRADEAKTAYQTAKAEYDSAGKAKSTDPTEKMKMLKDAARAHREAETQLVAGKIIAALSATVAASSTARAALTGHLSTLNTDVKNEALLLVEQLSGPSTALLDHFNTCFKSAQERAQQWFTIHTRICTVIASIIVAFTLQLDAFGLINQLSADPEMRAKLLSFSSDALASQGAAVLTNTISPATINQKAFNQLRAATNIAGITNLGPLPDSISSSRESVQAWLANSAATNHLNATLIVTTFQARADGVAKQGYDEAAKQFDDLNNAFGQTGLQLVPDPYPSLLGGHWSWPLLHFWGILSATALLSLGAPFWFNMLKTATDLRPVLAKQLDKEPAKKTG